MNIKLNVSPCVWLFAALFIILVSEKSVFAGEGPEDWLMQYYPVSETGVQPVPVCQYIDSRHCVMLAGVSGFDDREQN